MPLSFARLAFSWDGRHFGSRHAANVQTVAVPRDPNCSFFETWRVLEWTPVASTSTTLRVFREQTDGERGGVIVPHTSPFNPSTPVQKDWTLESEFTDTLVRMEWPDRTRS